MWFTTLDRKLLREVSRLKGQVVTIALVVASGIVCFISLRGTYTSLEASRSAYYDRYRFADVFARALAQLLRDAGPTGAIRRRSASPAAAFPGMCAPRLLLRYSRAAGRQAHAGIVFGARKGHLLACVLERELSPFRSLRVVESPGVR